MRDNLPAHKGISPAALEPCGGRSLRHLPPYSPGVNPIERACSKLKAGLRTAPARTREAQEAVVQTATDWITERDVKNGFDHRGYHVH